MMLDVTMARMVMGMTDNNDDDAVKVPATNQMVMMRRIELTIMSITLVNAIILWMRIVIIMMSMVMIIIWVVITLNATSHNYPTPLPPI